MCGIAGKIFFSSGCVSENELKKMSSVLEHRGPDDSGIYINPNRKVGLVNTRLAVIDLSAKGHMPMSYLKRYVITYNGEVYNFPKLRIKMQREGYKFSSHTDTEVILA